jgi:dTDP-4-dehydrorhamnose reductase
MSSVRSRGKPKVVILMGGGSGCVSNIIADRMMAKPDKYYLIAVGRTPMEDREGKRVPFIKYDLFVKGQLDSLIQSLREMSGDMEVAAVINCISTGGKLSYDTTKIAYLNYLATNTILHLAKQFSATLVHMSSMKVGTPESSDPYQTEGTPPWKGARSPYAWSKLAAELKLNTSDQKDMTFIRIGLMESEWGKRFYTRVRMYVDFPVAVTQEDDLQNAIEDAIAAKGRHITTCRFTKEMNGAFYKRMSGRCCLLKMPVTLFNYTFGSFLPTKMIDYVDPTHDFTYMLPL